MPKRPINILYFSSFANLRWGGQKSLFHLVTRLDPELFRPHVVVPAPGDLEETLRSHRIGVTILPLPKLLGVEVYKAIAPFRLLLEIIDRLHIDVIHTDGPRNTFYAGTAARIKGVPSSGISEIRTEICLMLPCFGYHQRLFWWPSIRSRFKWVTQTDKFVTIYNGVDLTAWSGNEPLARRKSNGWGSRRTVS